MNNANPDIRYLERKEIDTDKWDLCIAGAANSLIYARSFYLDTMAENWSALILNDYETVMPLTWKRKYGFSYLYQPAFTAQLGLFGKNNSARSTIEKFITVAKDLFRFCEIHLNYDNSPDDCMRRANYVLLLAGSYADIRRGYKKRLLENLGEAEDNQLNYFHSNDFSSTIRLFQQQYGKRFPHVKKKQYQQFSSLCQEMLNRNMLFVRQVKDQSGSLLTSSVFFTDERRIYNIMSVTMVSGREKKSHFYLIDQLIREFSSSGKTLDFEGSEIPGIADFYKKFGSENSPYPFLRFNNLAFPFRFFK